MSSNSKTDIPLDTYPRHKSSFSGTEHDALIDSNGTYKIVSEEWKKLAVEEKEAKELADVGEIEIPDEAVDMGFQMKKLWAFMGPGFLVATAVGK